MSYLEFAYCNECEDLVEFDTRSELVEEEYKGVKLKYKFRVARCKCCNTEVAPDSDYIYRKSNAKIEAYKEYKGLIKIDEITELLEKYDIGKEAVAEIAGFGKVTVKRYFEGVIPAKEYSDKLLKMLNDEEFFINLVDANKDKLKEVAYKKIKNRYERLMEIGESKLQQIINYIITNMEEVTPLALEKLLFFSQGVNYALNGSRLIDNDSQAWAHGPVYPSVYNQYKKYGYKPIDNGIKSVSGRMLSKVSDEELKAIDLVIHTFGLYSPKILENISHTQTPWKEKRIGYHDEQVGTNPIEEESIKDYYIELKLDSEERIMEYIMDCARR